MAEPNAHLGPAQPSNTDQPYERGAAGGDNSCTACSKIKLQRLESQSSIVTFQTIVSSTEMSMNV